jgi:hypothetical protein
MALIGVKLTPINKARRLSNLHYDYLNGRDFDDERAMRIRTKMPALTKENLAFFGDSSSTFSTVELDKVDFSRLSKTDNP